MKPLVSVVMSVYNAEKYLDESIQSILSQTYSNFEFIIINDGSTDESLEIIERYAEKDNRIIVISRENRGLIASLNEGIKKAKGKYIARMDADDISMPTRFEKQVEFMEKNKHIGICGTAVIGFGEDMKESIWKLSTKSSALKTQLLFSSCFAHPSVMMRKEVLVQNTLLYNQEFLHVEDYALWVELAKITEFANLSQPLLRYRVLKNSITRVADKNHQERYRTHQKIFTKYLDILGMDRTEDEKKLHFALSVNTRIKEAKLDFYILNDYFDKIVKLNNEIKYFDSLELKKVLGKKWLWTFYYRKNIDGLFSKYFLYGLWGMIRK